MTDHANLLLRFNAGTEPGRYRVTASLDLPGSAAPQGASGETEFDIEALEGLARANKWKEYGQELARSLFGPKEILAKFASARQATKGELPLRLRLWIEPDAAALHRLCWELLHDPKSLEDPEKPADWLATDQTLPLSRYIPSRDERRVVPRPFDSLRALVVVANPLDLEDHSDEHKVKLTPIKVAEEVARARQALGTIPVTLLCSEPGLEADGLPTLEQILTHLGQGGHDVLYLVAHGVLEGDNPLLWLEGDDREAKVISGVDTKDGFGEPVLGFVARLGKLPVLPRLVVLASCESANPAKAGPGHPAAEEAGEPASRDTLTWTALGPLLAKEGVPAVVAMQGPVTMETVGKFMPAFFAGLRDDGNIDRAMAAARGVVQDRWDWWMPVLFSRLHDGLLFSSYGWMVLEESDPFWDTLLDNIIRDKKCTPILGPGVSSNFLPSPAEVARSLAARSEYCLSRSNDNLPQVAQFYEVYQPASLKWYVTDILAKGFVRKMKERNVEVAPVVGSLSKTIEDAGWSELAQELYENEIHHQLADFRQPLYVTTNFDNFMALALRSKLKPGDVETVYQEVLPWRRKSSEHGGEPGWELDHPPSKTQHVVLHLFGTDSHDGPMVLAEDHYLKFLARAHREPRDLVPDSLRAALGWNSLLFLGYDLHDPAFKLILQGLLVDRSEAPYRSVAVQLDPSLFDEDHRAAALKYLKNYFVSIDTRLDVYWGSPHQFVAELHRRWEKRDDHG
jgi:hypothetical protein